MWTADKIIYNGIDTYIKAYQGNTLVWEKTIPIEPTDDITLPYVTFRAEEANSQISLNLKSSNQTFEYSKDKTTWKTFSKYGDVSYLNLTNIGDEVYLRGKLVGNNTSSDYTQFVLRGKIAAYGNCNALWDYENLDAPLKPYCGYKMFDNDNSLLDGALTKTPLLPATTLAESCYEFMFGNCELLKNVPEILPATTLAERCYNGMFYQCGPITKAPMLPATTLAAGCYEYMFYACRSLNEITCLATDMSTPGYLNYWVTAVSSNGTFYKNPSMTTWTTGEFGIPSGWTVLDYTA